MRFIAFEGLDGSGKSTLMQGLKAEFETRGLAFVLTREPGGTKLGDQIRHLLLSDEGEAPTPRTEALLYQAGRAQHVDQLIRPALNAKKWVLSDRFAASSLAFQSKGRDIGEIQIEWLNEFSTAGLKPDLYVLLDLTVEQSEKRLKSRGGEADRFEREDKAFHERVRQAYLSLAHKEPERWLVLSASDTPVLLLDKLIQALKSKKWLV